MLHDVLGLTDEVFDRSNSKIGSKAVIQGFCERVRAKRTCPVWAAAARQKRELRVVDEGVTLFDAVALNVKFVQLGVVVAERQCLQVVDERREVVFDDGFAASNPEAGGVVHGLSRVPSFEEVHDGCVDFSKRDHICDLDASIRQECGVHSAPKNRHLKRASDPAGDGCCDPVKGACSNRDTYDVDISSFQKCDEVLELSFCGPREAVVDPVFEIDLGDCEARFTKGARDVSHAVVFKRV